MANRYAPRRICRILQVCRRGGVLPRPRGRHLRFFETNRRTQWCPTGGASPSPTFILGDFTDSPRCVQNPQLPTCGYVTTKYGGAGLRLRVSVEHGGADHAGVVAELGGDEGAVGGVVEAAFVHQRLQGLKQQVARAAETPADGEHLGVE